MARLAVLIMTAALMLSAAPAWAKRVALVVGVGDYDHFNDLRNDPSDPDTTPARDARAFASAIQGHGFDVRLVVEATVSEIRAAQIAFLNDLEPEDEAMFFFSGHGAQKDGVNYLFGSDSRITAQAARTELLAGAVNLSNLLQDMQDRSRVSIIFLDACSTELPGAKSGQSKGLTFVEASEVMARGSFIGLASQENTPSFTGEGELSFYTAALVETLNEERYAADVIQRLHDEAGRRVREASLGQQSPTYRDNMGLTEYRLGAGRAPEPETAPQPDPAAEEANLIERIYWEKCDAGGAPYCDAYLEEFPSGRYVTLASLRRRELAAERGETPPEDPPEDPPTNSRGGVETALSGNRPSRDVAALCESVAVRDGCHCAFDDLLGEAREFCPPGLYAAVETPPEAPPDRAPEETSTSPEALERFRDCPNCPLMAVLPGGNFLMGAGRNERGRYSHEAPQRRVTVRPFAIAVHEVSFAEYDVCVAAGYCSNAAPSDNGWGRGPRPVIDVNWYDAQAYVDWLNFLYPGAEYRLPSEAEWEYAARAGSDTAYPWGNLWSARRANFARNKTSPAPARETNGFGLGNMIGNVAEWVADCWSDSHTGAPADQSPRLDSCGGGYVIRGGGWRDRPRDLRSAAREHAAPRTRRLDLGFRIARDVR